MRNEWSSTSSSSLDQKKSTSSSSTSCSRRGRRSCSNGTATTTTTDKPKQPQRGLGVAQLEKIRLHSLMEEEMRMQAYNNNDAILQHHQPTIAYPHYYPGTSQTQTAPYTEYHPINMGMEVICRSNIRFDDSHQIPNQFGTNSTRHLLNSIEDTEISRNSSYGSSTSNYSVTAYDSSGQDVDLELKL